MLSQLSIYQIRILREISSGKTIVPQKLLRRSINCSMSKANNLAQGEHHGSVEGVEGGDDQDKPGCLHCSPG